MDSSSCGRYIRTTSNRRQNKLNTRYMIERELTNQDWGKLINIGLVDDVGNGFANTTDKADKLINISSFKDTYIKIKGKRTIYKVRYYSGCFYPLWFVVYYLENNKEIIVVE